MSTSASHSLRKRLLSSLLGAITLAALIQAAAAYSTALSQADVIFDRHMQKIALSLSSGLPLANAEPNTDFNPDKENEDKSTTQALKKAPVWEIWCKSSKKLY